MAKTQIGSIAITSNRPNPQTSSGINTQAILQSLSQGLEYYISRNKSNTLSTDESIIVASSGMDAILFYNTVDAFPIVLFQIQSNPTGTQVIYTTYCSYLSTDGNIVVEQFVGSNQSKIIPIMTLDSMEIQGSKITISTADPDSTISALIDGIITEINNIPKTVNTTDGDVVIDVSTHSPKDKYTVQVNNGNNMLRLIDGSTQYNSFPASIPVEVNKTITAYGEADREITINYTNTGKPVITNT